MNCGDVVLVEYPFTNDSGSKVRPVLIVSADTYNRGEDRVCTPISSAPTRDDPYAFLLPESAPWFERTGLRKESSVKWTKLFTISRQIIRRQLGYLDDTPLAEILSKVQGLFER